MATNTKAEGNGTPTRAASLMALQARGKKVPPDALHLLEMDHRQVEGWFAAYPGVPESGRVALVRQLCIAIEAHMRIEEELFYPLVRDATVDDGTVDRAVEEHAEARRTIESLKRMTGPSSQMDTDVQSLEGAIREHVAEEEGEIFPRVRRSGLDLTDVGARLAAMRMAAFADLTGKHQPELDHHPDEGRRPPAGMSETVAARDNFIRCLRDAHAMEKQSETMLSHQMGRLGNYPDVEMRLQAHLEETREQLARIDGILADLGEGRSALKDMTATLAGRLGQIGQSATEDEILKNGLALFAFESFEAASYEQLLAMGELTGGAPAARAARLLQRSLSEERAMAAWLEANTPAVVQRFLTLSAESGQPVGR